jgi:hypothetical protein
LISGGLPDIKSLSLEEQQGGRLEVAEASEAVSDLEEQKDGSVEVAEASDEVGAVFVQNKFSEGGATTKLTVKTVTESLDKLILERGVLFFEDGGSDEEVRNQISALNIQERNVVLLFSVLRDLQPTFDKFAAAVSKHATKIGFKGAIVVADGQPGGERLYGDSFKRLALRLYLP